MALRYFVWVNMEGNTGEANRNFSLSVPPPLLSYSVLKKDFHMPDTLF